ncbi:MAG: carboxypeptidase-like regulatory domain-containing protein [Myxococcaceae bacterium]
MSRAMRWRWHATLGIAGGFLLAAACSPGGYGACASDSECGVDQVCFVDGCGDPSVGLVVEVTPSARSGAYPEDFSLESLRPEIDFTLSAPGALKGLILRAPTVGALAAPYDARVSFRANGRSGLIPGRSRHFLTSLLPRDGLYNFPLGTGVYSIVVSADDANVPPWTAQNIVLSPNQVSTLDVRFDPEPALLLVSGVLLGVSAPVAAPMEVQGLDADSQLPVSQRVAVNANGDFQLWVSSAAITRGRFWIRATPKELGAPAPKKDFDVPTIATLPDALRMGNFGLPIVVNGTAVDTSGAGIPDALVFVAGSAGGGGPYLSPQVRTDAAGAFQLQTLPSLPGGTLTLHVLPPATSKAATTEVILPPGFVVAPVQVSCPDRVVAMGRLLLPEGGPAALVRVSAEPLRESPDDVLPPAPTPAFSDEEGVFNLTLDIGRYRLDFVGSNVPRASRVVSVTTQASSLPLEEVVLSLGRRIVGTIRTAPIALEDGADPTPAAAPFALVRFFRHTSESSDSAELVAESYTDATGEYTVLLPTR